MQHIPMPRMTNTFMLAGESDPEEIIRSVPQGLYCANFGGGQVDITSGNFVFSAAESYLIEDGKITRPVRNATLIGNGPEALKYVSMVGNDLKLDEGIGRLRQGRPERAGGRRHPYHQDRSHDGGGHGVSAEDHAGVAAEIVQQALAAGATDAECTIGEGDEFSANVRLREVETLKEAGSRAAGLRILRGRNTGSAYTSDLTADGIGTWCVRRSSWLTSQPKIRMPGCRTLPSWARFRAIWACIAAMWQGWQRT